uniref:Uncharacterized protein n=1 Tax=Anguilla anguilla TaxID=7936 RepID=A0A0E9SWT3_ANGAN
MMEHLLPSWATILLPYLWFHQVTEPPLITTNVYQCNYYLNNILILNMMMILTLTQPSE